MIHPIRVVLGFALLLALPSAAAAVDGATARDVIELQRNRKQSTMRIPSGPHKGTSVTLFDLNPAVNRWFVLRVERPSSPAEWFHLENALPHTQRLALDAAEHGLVLTEDGERTGCALWPHSGSSVISDARNMRRPYVALCDERIYLRIPSVGNRTRKEWAADVLRDRVRHGEQITNFIKEKFFRDRYLRKGEEKRDPSPGRSSTQGQEPHAARLSPRATQVTLKAPELNLVVPRERDGTMRPGRWYPLDGYAGIFSSVITPDLAAEAPTGTKSSEPLEALEAQALVYLVAFDMSQFELGFALGTEHPRVGWSERVPEASRVADLSGPDGFDTLAPLARTGKLTPLEVERVAATFSGGFKRAHGAFKWGELSMKNRGSHYGFVESGTVLSTLQPGLATLAVFDDGEIVMKTWNPDDPRHDSPLVHARQNGVAIVEPGASGVPREGALVRDWSRGNWSGSQNKELRTLRAGAGLQETDDRTFLIYAYFTSVTPHAMARVFLAYGCAYAMHLDMNAPEHTYLAVYRVEEPRFIVQRLVAEMAEVDPTVDGQEVPRYVAYSDNRDFFYLLRKAKEDVSP